jgi:hypothetical protein
MKINPRASLTEAAHYARTAAGRATEAGEYDAAVKLRAIADELEAKTGS